MKYSLVIGMGIGQLYKDVLTNLGHEVVTVDLDSRKKPDFTDIQAALDYINFYDTVHICTPNFTHQKIAEQVATKAGIVFVEKPGFESADEWHNVVYNYPDTRFMMVKNNMWRDNINELRKVAQESESVELKWINKDRVPNPGTWFTTKELAYGGVSKDLMPHLLSLFAAFEPDFINAKVLFTAEKQEWELSDLTRSDYGIVNAVGTYDVDDFYHIEFDINGRKYDLTSQWRSMDTDERLIKFNLDGDVNVVAQLGLCPEDAYQRMIAEALANYNDMLFWEEQYHIDMWIHKMIETQ